MIIYLINILDLVSTLIALSHGAVELNPFLRVLMDIHPAVFPLVKIFPAYFLCMWLERNAKKSKGAKTRYIAIIFIYALVVANNLAVILMAR